MIDRRFQRRGYGKCALDLICSLGRNFHGARNILSSYVPGPHGPEQFYLNYGFQKTGNIRRDGKEIEIVLPL